MTEHRTKIYKPPPPQPSTPFGSFVAPTPAPPPPSLSSSGESALLAMFGLSPAPMPSASMPSSSITEGNGSAPSAPAPSPAGCPAPYPAPKPAASWSPGYPPSGNAPVATITPSAREPYYPTSAPSASEPSSARSREPDLPSWPGPWDQERVRIDGGDGVDIDDALTRAGAPAASAWDSVRFESIEPEVDPFDMDAAPAVPPVVVPEKAMGRLRRRTTPLPWSS